MGGSSTQHAGYRFFLDILMGFGRGRCDAIRRIRIGDREAWAGNVTDNAVIQIDKPDLFGGIDGAGGVVGDLHVQMGDATQARHPLITAAFGPLTSALRGVCTAFFTGQVCAIDPYPKPWSVQRTTVHTGWDGPEWYPAGAEVIPAGLPVPAMNPAHILIKVLTHRDCGRGIALTRIGLTSFQAAADQLLAEGFGLCLRWRRQVTVNEFLQQVADHIGMAMYVSRNTGQLTLTLMRGDYDPQTLPVYDVDSGLLEIEADDNPTGWGAVNEVVIEWTDPDSNEPRQTRWQNLAAIQAYGKVSESLRYPGIPTAALAARVAQREGEARSAGAKRFNLVFDRRGYAIEPAGLFRIQSPDHGIADMVLRAGDIRDGTLVDGRIRVVAVQDVFGLDDAAYVIDQPSTHLPPDRTPLAVAVRHVTEASYRDLARLLRPAELAAAAPEAGALLAMGRRPSGLSLAYKLATRIGSNPYAEVAHGDWCANAVLVVAIGPTDTVLAYAGGSDLQDVDVGESLLVDGEVMRVDAIDLLAATVTVGRGCVDTVPVAHSAGAQLWFVEAGAAVDPTEYVDGETVDVKLLTRTSSGKLSEMAAPADSLTFDQRQARPYPPGRLRISDTAGTVDAAYPAEAYGALTATWAHRDRVLQADQLVDEAAVSIGPELGATYTARWYLDGALVRTQAGIAGANDTYTPPAGSGGQTVRVEIESVRDGLTSWQVATRTFLYRAQLVTDAGDRIVTEAGDPITLE